MRRPLAFALALTVLAVAAPPTASAQGAAPDPLAALVLPEVVARVGEVTVTRAEALTQARLMRGQAVAAGFPDPAGRDAAGLVRAAVEGLVDEALLYLDARRRGTAVGDAEVDAKVAEMAATFASAADFDAALAAQGTSREGLRRQLRQTLTIEKVLRDEIGSTVAVGEAEKRAFYESERARLTVPERYRIRHVLIRVAPGADAEERDAARRRAEAVLGRVRAGEDLGTLAAGLSEDLASRENGGELPWVTPSGGAGSPLDAAVARLQPGGVAVVETQVGFHVVELLERRAAATPPYEEVAGRIEDHLRQAAIQDAVAQRVARLRAATAVEILL